MPPQNKHDTALPPQFPAASPSPPSSPAMAVTKLNPSAPPFHCSRRHLFHPPPPSPQLYGLYQGGACTAPFPFVATYSCGGFPVLGHAYPSCGGYPVKTGTPPPPPPKLFSKIVVAAPPPPPHGCPQHKLMWRSSAATVTEEKLHAQAQAAAKARAAVAVKAALPRRVLVGAAPCGVLQPAEARRDRGMSKEYRPRQARARREMSPPALFTTRPTSPVPPMQELKPSQTTVMVRNIPNKLTRMDMVRLLDDHCARANRRRGGAARAEYDLVYVRMDFGMCNEHRSSNMGYAFVNFTTAEAARRLQHDLHGCRWKKRAFDSAKIIDIRAARIQGKEALLRHFGQTTYYGCSNDEYLPAVFSPPRDGSAAGEISPAEGKVKTVGHRIPSGQITCLSHRGD